MIKDTFRRNRLPVSLDDSTGASIWDGGPNARYVWESHGEWTLKPDYPFSPRGINPPTGEFYAFYVASVGDTVELSVSAGSPHSNQGVVAFWADPDNWIGLLRDGDDAVLQACTAGVVTTIGTVAAPGATFQAVMLSVYGDWYTCSVYPDASVQFLYTGEKPGQKHGLISYDNDTEIDSVTITPEPAPTIDVRGVEVVTAASPTTVITCDIPERTRRNDYLLAVVAAHDYSTITVPSGWSQVMQLSDYSGAVPGNKVTIAVFGRFWRPGDPTTFDTTGGTARTHIVSVAAFGGVDFDTPVSPDLNIGRNFFHNPGIDLRPYWVGASYNYTQISVGAFSGIDPNEKYPPDRGFELWDEQIDGEIASWCWFGRRRTDYFLEEFHDDAWITPSIPLIHRTQLGVLASNGRTRRLRSVRAGNYIDALLRDSPTVLWPLDEPWRIDGTSPTFEPVVGPDNAYEDGVYSDGSSFTIFPGIFGPQDGDTIVGSPTVSLGENLAVSGLTAIASQAPPPGVYDGSEDFSMEYWFRYNEWDAAGNPFGVHVGGVEEGFGIAEYLGDLSAVFYGYDAANTTHAPILNDPEPGDLHHVALSFTSGVGIRTFLDGGPVGGVTVPLGGPSGEYLPFPPAGGLHVTGFAQVGYIAAYQSALTDEQVHDHYVAGIAAEILGSPRAAGHVIHPSELHTPELGTARAAVHSLGIVKAHTPTLTTIRAQGTLVLPTFVPAHRPVLVPSAENGHLHDLFVIPRPTPAPVAGIERTDVWQQMFTGHTSLPFHLVAGDVIALVCMGLEGTGGTVELHNFTLRDVNQEDVQEAIGSGPGMYFYAVVSASGNQSLDSGEFTVAASIAVYRGVVQVVGPAGDDMWWGQYGSVFYNGTIPALSYTSPDGSALCLRGMYLSVPESMYPLLSDQQEASAATVVDTWTIPADTYQYVDYGEMVTVTLAEERVTASPTEEWNVRSEAEFDYTLYSYMSLVFNSRLTTVVLVSGIGPLEVDLDNPAPLGTDRYPIGTRVPETPVGITDEDGDVLADEDGNELVWA